MATDRFDELLGPERARRLRITLDRLWPHGGRFQGIVYAVTEPEFVGRMPKRVDVPTFELAGPPCRVVGCQGVLVPSVGTKDAMYRDRCSRCGQAFNEAPVLEKVGWARRTIERVLKGEKES